MSTQAHPTTGSMPTASPTRFWLAATLLTLVLGSAWIWVSAPGRTSAVLEDSAGPFIGHTAPPIQLVSLEDPTVAVAVNGVGVPVVLNFWASWCNPCRREIPELVEATRRFGQEVRVVGTVMPSDAEGARTMADEFGINYELTVDAALGDRRGTRTMTCAAFRPPTYILGGQHCAGWARNHSGSPELGCLIRAKVTGEMRLPPPITPRQHRVWGGRAFVRTIFCMTTVTATRYNPAICNPGEKESDTASWLRQTGKKTRPAVDPLKGLRIPVMSRPHRHDRTSLGRKGLKCAPQTAELSFPKAESGLWALSLGFCPRLR